MCFASHTCENISHYIPRKGCEQDGRYHEIYPEPGVGNNAGGGTEGETSGSYMQKKKNQSSPPLR